jgi:TRAP-type mannitol/chloroaromatic compound transport system permease large subunit
MLIAANTLDLRVARDEIPARDMVGIAVVAVATAGLAWGIGVSLVRVYRTKAPGANVPILHEVMRSTLQISAMVFVILIGASVFSLVFRGLGGDEMVHKALSALPGGAVGAVTVVMLVMFILGFFIDFIEIVFVVVPVVAPALLLMDINPIWLGVLMGVNLQTSFLTPPFGFALFYLRGVAPPQVTTGHIYRGIVPFVAIQLFALVLLAMFPALATWLPQAIFSK